MDQLNLTAIHEAAHAVVGVLVGREVTEVTVRPAEGSFGHCRTTKDVNALEDEFRRLRSIAEGGGEIDMPKLTHVERRLEIEQRRMLLGTLAGPAAEMWVSKASDGSSGDFLGAQAIIRTQLVALFVETDAPSEDVVLEVFALWYRRAEDVLMQPGVSEAIRAVADLLLKHETIEGAEVARVAAQVPPLDLTVLDPDAVCFFTDDAEEGAA